ncbi:hypothetical protein HK100_007108 [Physocladia obscura]|uniref:Choline/carnitine acyltransferase domain-containing protein n=1 Tax=Physocladia obscura TaxID=109957 RepID=A0AAD5XEZ9_9FUNG|nr:hypothetical protein HK100_007108 [Physocladia obscura]
MGLNEYQPATFALQYTLPRLPIPSLQETLALYLKTLVPIARSNAELKKAEAVVKQFEQSSAAAQLQARLIEHDKLQPGSWLYNWWLQLAYHSWRESVLINSNWYIIFRDDENTPKTVTKEFTLHQVKRAANLTAGYLEYKDKIDRETLAIETTKAGPICMNQYRNLFGVTRVPKKDCDYNAGSFPSQAKHICLSVRDQFYAVPVYVNGQRLSAEAIEKQFWKVIEAVKSNKELQPPVGILTCEHRDTWADAHEHLIHLEKQNKDSFAIIESALFNVALDEYIVGPSTSELAKYVFHNFDGRNRWFDKSITVCVSSDARAGGNGEHSPLDALVAAFMLDYGASFKEYKKTTDDMITEVAETKPIIWIIDAKTNEFIENGKKFAKKLIADSDLEVTNFKKFGTDFIKKQVGASPDAFMQMALQLTYFRIHKKFPAVYETASTRKYLFGRTETGRSLSIDSVKFINVFENPSSSPAQKIEALKTACKSHVEYLTKAGNGYGVDRHLLGLRLVMKPGESFEIFKDPLFSRSQHWDLSTSGLFSSKNIIGTGFGCVYPDGYGMNYALHNGSITIGIESKFSEKTTSTSKYILTLAKVLDDLHATAVAIGASKL